MIVKFQNIGVENKTVLFYGVEDVNDSCCLRICVEELLKDKKNLKNEVIDTWRYHDNGSMYGYIGKNELGYLQYKKL